MSHETDVPDDARLEVTLEARTRQVVAARKATVEALAAVERWVIPFRAPIGRYFSIANSEYFRAMSSGRVAKMTGVAKRRTRRVQQQFPDIGDLTISDPAVAQYFETFDGRGIAHAARLARQANLEFTAVPIDEVTRSRRLHHARCIVRTVPKGSSNIDQWLARDMAEVTLESMPDATHEIARCADVPSMMALFGDDVIEGLEAGRTDLLVKDVVRLAGATRETVELLQFALEGIGREQSHLLDPGSLLMDRTTADAAEIRDGLRVPEGGRLQAPGAGRSIADDRGTPGL
jgi:hypothetical protein